MAWGDDAKLGTGLPDRFALTIARTRMETPEGWNNPVVVFTGEQNVDGEIEDGDLRLSAGASFEGGDKEGTFLVHETQTPEVYDDPSARKKKINKNSAYGRFLESALEVGVPLEENQDPARAKYQIWDLQMWEGLVIDVEMVEREFEYGKDHPKAGQKGTTRDAYVRGFLGKSDGSTPPATPSATSDAPSPTPSNATSNGSVDPKAYDTHMSYLEAYVAAGGDTGDEQATKAFWEAARA